MYIYNVQRFLQITYTYTRRLCIASTLICTHICSYILTTYAYLRQNIGHPPPEDRLSSLAAFDIDDIFGNGTRSRQIMHMQV